MSTPAYEEKPDLVPAEAAVAHDVMDLQPLGLAEEEYQHAVRRLRWKVCLPATDPRPAAAAAAAPKPANPRSTFT